MKKLSLKAVSCALIVAMVLPLAACNKNKSKSREKSRSGTVIAADAPWFESSVIKSQPEVDTKKGLEYASQALAGTDDKYVGIYSNGYYKMPTNNNIDWETFDYSKYMIAYLSLMDKKTAETVKKIDLSEYLPKNGYVEQVNYSDGKFNVRITSFDSKSSQMTVNSLVIDAMSGKLVDKKEMPYDEESGRYFDHTFELGLYTFKTSMNWDENDRAYYSLYISKGEDSDVRAIELKDNEKNIYDVPIVLKLSDDKYLAAANSDMDTIYYEIDVNSYTATAVDSKKYEWLDARNIGNTFAGKDGTLYCVTGGGVSKIDTEKKKLEEIFNYSWCSVNRGYMSYMQLVECSEDSIVLWGEKPTTMYVPGVPTEYMLITLNRASTNPHAGKKILELYAPYNSVDINIGEAIIKFNETNGSYFIEASDRYSDSIDDDTDYSKLNSDDDWQSYSLKYNSSMSNELAMDILNGEGPDILLNTSEYGQLNNTNYLVDLNTYIGNLDSNKYFTNIIEASETDGKLFQLPLCYMINGIQTDAKYAGKSGVGFTTEEYEKFLKETLNGQDVINLGQATYFSTLFGTMSDKFIVNGKADFTGPEFAALAEYVKYNVPEKAKSWDEMYGNDESVAYAVGAMTFKGDRETNQIATYTLTYGYNGYFAQIAQLNGATAILGLPSADGRGPMLQPYISLAVSAQSKNADACGEFVKMLMTDDVQMELGTGGNFVLLKEAFRKGAKEAVEFMNGPGGESYLGYDKNDQPLSKKFKFSDKNIDELEKIVSSISRMDSVDAAISLILVEEMPAYFSGQKELDQVVKIAQDRAQKVLAERG